MPFAAFLIELAATYILNRLQQPNGPRVTDLSAGLGDYGMPKPRLYGEAVRVTGVVIAQDDIKETVHKHKPKLDYLFGIIGALLPPTKTYTYSDTLALLVADREDADPIEDLVKLYAAGKLLFKQGESTVVSESFDLDGNLISRKYGPNRYCKSVTVYGGGLEQTADPILVAAVGEQPGYRNSAYVVLEDLQLIDFGNAVPVPIEALVKVRTGETLASVSESICAAAGIDHLRDVSTTALDHAVKGYALTSELTCWDAIKPLLPAFAVDAAEVAGQIRFYRRSQSMRASLTPDDMGAHIYGDSPPEKFLFKRAGDLDLPQETALTFIDPDRDYQPNTATSRRSEGSAVSNISTSIPLVMDASEGATAAALLHWDAWLGRTQANFALTDVWHGIEPGLAYGIPIGGQTVPYRITRKTRGANGIIEIEALSDETVTYTADVEGTSGNVPDDDSTLFPDTRAILIDGPLLSDDDDEYGFYVVEGGSERYWTGGYVEASTDGINFVAIADSASGAVMGDVDGTLAAGSTTGLDDTLDTATVLTVVLDHDGMLLSSITDAGLDAWDNLVFVGKDGLGEYLQFKTATKVDFATWELTDLRRGRRGTDWAIDSHVSGEEFALLSEGGVFRADASTTASWGVPLTVRAVTIHQDVADADEQTFTNTGEGKRPFSPVNVEGTWDGSNNLTITWDSRSRLFAGGLGVDDQNNYEVEIISGAGRVITATGVETASYSAANQVTDGITPGDSIQGRVRQLSDVNDGRWRDFLLLGPDDSWELEDDLTPIHLEDGTTPLELES